MKIIGKKRRRECKTNYAKRKRLLESRKARIVIRKSNRYVLIQYVESKMAQDKIICSAISKELLGYGWPKEKAGSLKSLAACYLTGILFGKKIKDKEREAIVDLGLVKSTKGSRIYAALKGIVETGVNSRHDAKMFPEEKRIIRDEVKEFFNSVKDKIAKGAKESE